MKTLTVALPGREYEILIQRGLLDRAGELLGRWPEPAACLVGDGLQRGPPLPGPPEAQPDRGRIPGGLPHRAGREPSKCADQLAELWENTMDFGSTRTDAVVALGGGVVDLAGFAAATILRGVAFVQIPRLHSPAQVDSSVGGCAIHLLGGQESGRRLLAAQAGVMEPEALWTPCPIPPSPTAWRRSSSTA